MLFIDPEKPFAPSRSPIFYGWVVLFCGAVGVLMSLPGQTMGVAVFTDSLIDSFGLSRIQLSTAYMIGTITSSFFLPRAGRLYDRIGARSMTPVVAFLLGLTLVVMSGVDGIAELLAKPAGPAFTLPITFILMTLVFVFLRFLGQGTLTMVSKNMAMKWFVRRRGLANGLLGVAISFGFSAGVIGMNLFVESFGWREACWILGAVTGIGFALFSLIFFRDNPEECNLEPDGGPGGPERKQHSSAGRPATLQEAKESFLFWWFLFGLALIALLHTAISFHIISIFAEAGHSRNSAVQLFLHMAFISTAVTLTAGWISDHVHLKYVLATMAFGMLVTCVSLVYLELPTGRTFLFIGMGIGQGCFGILSTLTWPHFFGIAHLGAISGFAMSGIVFASALGPMLYGSAFYLWQSYDTANILCAALSAFLLLGARYATFRAE